MRDTSYATELATGKDETGRHRIERLRIKESGLEEIRFSWWPDGRLANRPLDLPESELLPLIEQAIKAGVFSDKFLKDLHSLLYELRAE